MLQSVSVKYVSQGEQSKLSPGLTPPIISLTLMQGHGRGISSCGALGEDEKLPDLSEAASQKPFQKYDVSITC